jgi:hypothetical protein
MAKEMRESERSVFALHGATGMLIATALLLTILAILATNAVSIQHEQAENAYSIEADKLKMISNDNYQYHNEKQ